MKTKSLIIIAIISFFFTSCEESSGSWTNEEKSNFIEYCKDGMPEQTEKTKIEYCNCSLGIAMSKWRTGAEADREIKEMTLSEIMNVVSPCLEFITE